MSKPGPGDSFFVGIGAQKAATSWLADYLDGHPQVGFSPIKELHYFDAVYCPRFCGNYHRDMRKRLAKLASDIPSKPSEKWYRKLNTYGLRVRMMEKPEVYREYFERLRRPEHRTVGEITPAKRKQLYVVTVTNRQQENTNILLVYLTDDGCSFFIKIPISYCLPSR